MTRLARGARSRPRFLIVAVTGRALAASAARAGYSAIVLDYFADRDTCALATTCRAVAAARGLRFDRRRLLEAKVAMTSASHCAGLVYGSGFEGRPDLLARLARGLRLYGNAPSVVAAVKDPGRFFGLLDRLGIRHPEVRLTSPTDPAGWLIKQPGGAGGAQVRHAGRLPAKGPGYFQRLAPGRPLSALFLANGRRACILGFNEQWTVRARSDLPFLYGGAVGGIGLPPAIEGDVRSKLDALVSATGLVGLNGIDFLLHGGTWSVLEVNPRPTATMELYDPDYPRGLFEWHLRACEGELPARPARPRAVRAHAIVRAASNARATAAFDLSEWCRDVPHPGTCFAPGDPVCTVHAAAADAERTLALLRRRHALVERMLREAAA